MTIFLAAIIVIIGIVLEVIVSWILKPFLPDNPTRRHIFSALVVAILLVILLVDEFWLPSAV